MLGLSREETTVFMVVVKGVLILDILDILKLCQQDWMQSVRENGLKHLDRWKDGIVINQEGRSCGQEEDQTKQVGGFFQTLRWRPGGVWSVR